MTSTITCQALQRGAQRLGMSTNNMCYTDQRSMQGVKVTLRHFVVRSPTRCSSHWWLVYITQGTQQVHSAPLHFGSESCLLHVNPRHTSICLVPGDVYPTDHLSTMASAPLPAFVLESRPCCGSAVCSTLAGYIARGPHDQPLLDSCCCSGQSPCSYPCPSFMYILPSVSLFL